MDSAPETSASEQDSQTRHSEERVIDHERLARLVIRDGKPFKQSALDCGYSYAVAANGLKRLMQDSNPVTMAVQHEYDNLTMNLERMKPMAVKRLYYEIADVSSPFGMRAIEIAGKFRETDWFVRNVDIQLGVFMGMTDQSPETNVTDTFKE